MKKYGFIITLLLITLVFTTGIGLTNDKPTVAVVNFTNNTGYNISEIENTAGELISTLLSNKSNIQVVERSKLKNIVKEQKFTTSGLVNQQETAIKLGKLLGAEYIVTGSLMTLNINETTFDGYEVETSKVDVSLNSNIKVLNVNTGVIEQGNIYEASKSYQGETKYSLDSAAAVRSLLNEISRDFVSDFDGLGDSGQKDEKKIKVEFISDPEGASIEVDGIYMGSTPTEIPLTSGVHSVKISMGGYNSWEKKVNVFEGLKVNAVLGEKQEKDEGEE